MNNLAVFESPVAAPAADGESTDAESAAESIPKVADFLHQQNYNFARLQEIALDAADVFTSSEQLDNLAMHHEQDAWDLATYDAKALGFSDPVGVLRAQGGPTPLDSPAAIRRGLFLRALSGAANAELLRQMGQPDPTLFDPNMGVQL